MATIEFQGRLMSVDEARQMAHELSLALGDLPVSVPKKNLSLLCVEWAGNLMIWAGGIIMVSSPDLAKSSWQLFALLLTGQLLWVWASYHIGRWSLLASAVFFAALNLYGIFVRI